MADSQTVTELRREKIRLRRGMSKDERMQKSAAVTGLLLAHERYRTADTILVYVSYGEEVSTPELIRTALAQGKRVFCPRVEGKEMEFYRIFSMEELTAGFHGILEPKADAPAFDGREKGNVLLLTPGTVFDRMGHRIGYGGGYYDRYLARFLKEERPYCIGLCFACQLTERIEPKAHDIIMDAVIFS